MLKNYTGSLTMYWPDRSDARLLLTFLQAPRFKADEVSPSSPQRDRRNAVGQCAGLSLWLQAQGFKTNIFAAAQSVYAEGEPFGVNVFEIMVISNS